MKVITGFFGLFIVFFSIHASAQNFIMHPNKILEDVPPGQSKTFELTLINESSHAIPNLQLEIRDVFFLTNDSNLMDMKKIRAGKEKNPKSLVSNVKAPSIVNLPAKSVMKIPIIVSMPKDFKGAGMFNYVIHPKEEKQKDAVIHTVVNFNGIGVINASGTEVFDLDLTTPVISNKTLKVKYNNKGNSMLQLTLEAVIINDKNMQVARVDLKNTQNKALQETYPGQTYELSASVPDSALKKPFKILINLKDEKRKFTRSKIFNL